MVLTIDLRFKGQWFRFSPILVVLIAVSATFSSAPLLAQVSVSVNANTVLATMPDVGINLHTSVYSNNFAQPALPGQIAAGGIQMLRYPGGNYADIYHWSNHTASGGYAASATHFGSFVSRLLDGSGAQGMVTVNYGASHQDTMPGQPKEAAAWVAYANADASLYGTENDVTIGVDDEGNDWRTVGYWARLRGLTAAENTDNQYDFLAINRDAPIGIKYWEVGNELNGNGYYSTGLDWQHDLHAPYVDGISDGQGGLDYPNRVGDPRLSPTAYGQSFIDFADAMKAVDPTIKVGAVLVGSGAGNTADPAANWDRNVMLTAGEHMDFGIYHWYPGGSNNVNSNTNSVLNATDDLPAEFNLLRSRMNTNIHPGAADEIEIHMTEFGYFGVGLGNGADGVFAANTYATALEQGIASVAWLELNKNSFLGDGAPIKGGAYYGIQLFSQIAEAGAEFVQATSSSGSVEVHSTVLPDGRVGLLIANLNSSGTSTVNIDVNDVDLDVSGATWLYGVNQATPLETLLESGLGNSFSVDVPFRSVMAVLIDAVASLAGDFNGDNVVDAADYTVWRNGLGSSYTPEDYDVWRANFGATLAGGGSTTSANVPEPQALLLCFVGLLAAAVLRRWSSRPER